MQRIFQGYKTEHCSFFSGPKNLRRMKRKPQQASTTVIHSASASRDQRLLSGHAVFLETPIHHCSACRVRDHRCLSPFLSNFSQIEGHQINFVQLVCLQAADTRTLAHQHINNHGIHHNALDPSLVSSTICICWALEHCILPCCIVQICSAPLATVDYSRLPANIRMQDCYLRAERISFQDGFGFWSP
jgi:hypothetical protein